MIITDAWNCLTDGMLGGVVSWYSVIHTPPGEFRPYFAEVICCCADSRFGDGRHRWRSAWFRSPTTECWAASRRSSQPNTPE
ncbi:hypothetical protein EJK15_40730 [Nonomuraea basaltis]|nr:hypothetical protein EJK15_40730 [Nonomuraea basaltis]